MSQKKYWQSLEHYNQDPEFVAEANNEFTEPIPVEEFLSKTQLDEGSTSRRDFLKFMGFSLAAATVAACEAPVVRSIPYLNKPEDVTPGVASFYATTYADGIDYASILVRSREGRPIHIEGNHKSSITKGGVSARVNSSVLSLYDSGRLTKPTIDGASADWADVDAQIMDKLHAIANKGGKVRMLTNTVVSPTTRDLIKEFGAHFGIDPASVKSEEVEEKAEMAAAPTGDSAAVAAAAVEAIENAANGDMVAAVEAAEPMMDRSNGDFRHVTYDAVSYSGLIEGNRMSFGKAVIPSYHFDKAKVIVSVGADFITNWLSPVEFSGQYSKNKKPVKNPSSTEWMSKHFQFEANLSVTGSNADVRGAIKPSEYAAAVIALHNAVTGESLSGGDLDDENGLVDKIQAAADALNANAGAGLVVSGSNDPNVQVIVNKINDHLKNYGSTIDMNRTSYLKQGSDAEVEALIAEMNSGAVDALIIYGTNPVYSMPAAWDFAGALENVGTTISFASSKDETAALCEYVCPDNHYLESWNDAEPYKGKYSLTQPVIKELFNTRQAQSSLLTWIGKDADFYTYLQNSWRKAVGDNPFGMTFREFWNSSVHDGVAEDSDPKGAQPAFSGNASSAASKAAGAETGDWELILYTKTGIGEGTQANNPWLQELPDPITKVVWDNYITMNPVDMDEMGLNIRMGEQRPASMANVSSGDASVELPVVAVPGQKRKTIGIALGYGRVNNRVEDMVIGSNVFPMVGTMNGTLNYANYNVSVSASDSDDYPLASTQTHHTMMGRKLVHETSMKEFQEVDGRDKEHGWNKFVTLKNAYGEDTPVKELGLWDDHPIDMGHRWGMSIDLNACNGCGACVTACTSENNVPVVGKDEVRRNRSMHWLRIDRYYSSDADPEGHSHVESKDYAGMEIPSEYPEVAFQPVMCQHCNHAPCETVCPVAATTHSNEGFNQMAYNRCVGTRYCANNCPFKVRRFNWFNYTAYSKFTDVNPSQNELGRMVLNPDVVVRSRGVMEKCSLCVQRVQAGKLVAKKAGEPVKDGAIQTACSAACAADAITFGDINNTESMVRENAKDERSYHLLEEIGVQPNIWYMTKVRNNA